MTIKGEGGLIGLNHNLNHQKLAVVRQLWSGIEITVYTWYFSIYNTLYIFLPLYFDYNSKAFSLYTFTIKCSFSTNFFFYHYNCILHYTLYPITIFHLSLDSIVLKLQHTFIPVYYHNCSTHLSLYTITMTAHFSHCILSQ